MEEEDMRKAGLVLGLGLSSSSAVYPIKNTNQSPKRSSILTLRFSPRIDEESGQLTRQASSMTAVSSFEREDKVSSRVSDEDEDGGSSRKKLRLSKEQSTLLEESFKQQSTLNPKQKQSLARDLNLRPRQVEVWFQNRRARTKLKQTEVDCEFLKKCCEALTDENRKLQKELQELRTLKLAHPFYAATLTMCPSCERISGVSGDGTSKNAFIGPKPHFFNPFANSSAAC